MIWNQWSHSNGFSYVLLHDDGRQTVPPEHDDCKQERQQQHASQHNACNEQLVPGCVIGETACSSCICAQLVCLQAVHATKSCCAEFMVGLLGVQITG